MSQKVLVTGANGHLGNNLVRLLIKRGYLVVAGIRNPQYQATFEKLGCELAFIDLQDKTSLLEAMRGVDIVYQVGAVFKHWSQDPEQEIYQANLKGTQNIVEAASEAKIKKLIYVSSLGALDRIVQPIQENTWNPCKENVYFRSKTDSEKLAWELARKYQVNMISVLPGAIIGGDYFSLTPTLKLFDLILKKKMLINPGFYFNFIDVFDVAQGCVLASTLGRVGERYLLANEKPISLREVITLIQEQYPEKGILNPPKPPFFVVKFLVRCLELMSLILKKEPDLQMSFLSEFTTPEYCDLRKTQRDLGFIPQRPEVAIRNTLHFMANKKEER